MIERNSQLIEDVLKNCDIVEVISSRIKVEKHGRSYKAICPFHDDSNPSLSISKEKQIFKCFSCNESGNAITFIQKFDKVSFFEAMKRCAEICGFKDERLEKKEIKKKLDPYIETLYNCLNDITAFYKTSLYSSESGKKALEYLYNRGLNDDIIRKFDIGYSQENSQNTINFLKAKGYSIKTIERTGIGTINSKTMTIKDNNASRVIFPLKDYSGQVVGFSARKIVADDNLPKYVNTPTTDIFDKGKILYNFDKAKIDAKRNQCLYLLEGFMDVIALARVKINNAVALMGTALTKDHALEFKKLNVKVILCLDLDDPGQNNTLRCLKILDENQIDYSLVNNDVTFSEKDCDEILKNHGSDFLNNYLKDTIDKGTWLINYYSKKLDLTKLNDKKKLINVIINEAIKNSNLYDVDFYFTKLSKLTGFDKSVFYSHYSQLVNAKNKNQSANKVKTEIPYVNVKEHDNKYLLLQRKIIYYMLENTDAIRLFKEKNVFLKNTDLRQIAKELCNFFDSNLDLKKIDVNLFLNYIDLNDSIADKKEKKSIISDIAFNKKMLMAPYTKEEFLITCDSLALESAKLRQKQEFDEISKSLSGKDKAIIAKDFINKTKESLK